MGKLNSTKLLLLTLTYLFISVAFVFYLPPETLLYSVPKSSVGFSSTKGNQQHKGQQDSAQMRRPDKSTLEERKNVIITPLALAALIAVLIWVGSIAFTVLSIVRLPENYLLNNRQYAYLTLCTFRI